MNQYILPVFGSLADFQIAEPPPPRDDAVLPEGEAERVAELPPGLLLRQFTTPLLLLVALPEREGGPPPEINNTKLRGGREGRE